MGETKPDDLVAVVSPSDMPIGALRRDELLRRPGVHFRTAHIFVFDRSGRLLLQQLAATRDRNPLRWGSSVAAYVQPGESYKTAALRRSAEELGAHLELDLVGKTEMPDLGGVKHIELFAAGASPRTIRSHEPGHIAALSWVPMDIVTSQVRNEPMRFTETFRWLFERFYGDAGQRRAAGG